MDEDRIPEVPIVDGEIDRPFTTDDNGAWNPDVSEAQSLLLEESRRVIDRQHTKTDNIDDKAARTVRLTLIVLGLVISGATYLDGGVNILIRVGVGFLVLAVLFGVSTYGTSNLFAGVTTRMVDDEHRIDPDVEHVRSDVLVWFEWIVQENRYLVSGNAALLAATRALFTAAIIVLTYGAGAQAGELPFP
ncbi:hypothetical protein [Natronomonas sp. EA1]|uniref:hypothetical protein n=1 Tax=Natronomonas sp. EA1 TaxID=3421655 RepID=UPI003EBFA171